MIRTSRNLFQTAARWQVPVTMLLFAAWIFTAAALRPGDANWDLRNYHLYGPFALLHGKWRYDFAPAQIQSFHAPTLDIPYYLLVRRITSLKWLNLILAVPHVIAVEIAFLFSLCLLDADRPASRLTAAIATLFGASGIATFSVLCTTMSDMPAVALILAGLLVLFSGRPCARRVMLAGLLVGGAVGLKLTLSYVAVGLALAVPVLPGRARERGTRLLWLGIGGVLGVAITGGWWYAMLWQHWRDPLFPYYNNIFHSPWAPPFSFEDKSFTPPSWREFLLYPVLMALHVQKLMTEVPARDPRFLLGILGAILLLAHGVWRRAWRDAALAVLFLAGFLLWEHQFAIFRYLSGLELITGTVLALALRAVFRFRAGGLLVPVLLLVLLAGADADTMVPDWGHAAAAPTPIAVHMPAVAPDGMVLLLAPEPMSYLAVFQPVTVRFLGINNNMLPLRQGPEYRFPQDYLRRAIAGQHGEIWGLDMPRVTGNWGDLALQFYGLRRLGCTQVQSNLDYSLIRMCRLARQP